MKMKKTAKTLAMVLLASTSAKALEKPVLISSAELQVFEQKKNLNGLAARLIQNGILVQTNKQNIYILNDMALSNLKDEAVLSIISDLINWVTNSEVQVESKNWKGMTPTTQDYKAE